jgi:peptide/nickel transport system substrate-binding protein
MRRHILFALLALAGCTQVAGGGWHGGSDTLRIGAAISPNSFNPILVTESIENNVDRLIYNGLTLVDDSGRVLPDLATEVPTLQNGGIGKDGLTITYHLRRGVTWQDGAPFSSDDVRFSYSAVMNPNTLVANRVGYDKVARVDTPDPYTVVFHLKERHAPFVTSVFNSGTVGYVVPAHLLRKYHDLNRVPFNAAPVGTGAYRMVRWARGDRIEFRANETYFKGVPKIKNIVLYDIPQENTGISQLQTRELDWYHAISEASYGVLKDVPGIKIIATPQNAYRSILINNERLRDVLVRRAIAYAIDKAMLVRNVTHGTGTLATEDIPSFMWAYDKDVPTYNYDPPKARALLAQAGWRLGSNGILQRNGQPLSLTMVLRQGAAGDNAMAVVVQSWLRAVGIELTIKTFQGSTLFALGPSGVLEPGKYDLDISGFASSADPDNSLQFMCRYRPPNGFNWIRYCNPAMDRAQTEAVQSYDQTARKRAYAKIERLLATDVPQIFIYYQPDINAINPALRNFKPSIVTPMWNAHEWQL